MNSRRQARITAYETLYQRSFLNEYAPGEKYLLLSSGLEGKNLAYGKVITELAWKHREFAEETMRVLSERNVHAIRTVKALGWLTINEMVHCPETDHGIVINEALEICKSHVGAKYVPYFNVLLDRVYKTHRLRQANLLKK